MKERLNRAGIDPAGGTAEEFGGFIRTEFDKWGQVVKAAGIKAN